MSDVKNDRSLEVSIVSVIRQRCVETPRFFPRTIAKRIQFEYVTIFPKNTYDHFEVGTDNYRGRYYFMNPTSTVGILLWFHGFIDNGRGLATVTPRVQKLTWNFFLNILFEKKNLLFSS